MPPALTPDLAVAYVRELSADVRAVAVLAADGALLAGDAAVAAAAAPLLEAGAEAEVAGEGGVVCAARDDRHAIVAVCGRFALPAVVRTDLRGALAALRGTAPAGPPDHPRSTPGSGLEQAAERAILAAQRGPGA